MHKGEICPVLMRLQLSFSCCLSLSSSELPALAAASEAHFLEIWSSPLKLISMLIGVFYRLHSAERVSPSFLARCSRGAQVSGRPLYRRASTMSFGNRRNAAQLLSVRTARLNRGTRFLLLRVAGGQSERSIPSCCGCTKRSSLWHNLISLSKYG